MREYLDYMQKNKKDGIIILVVGVLFIGAGLAVLKINKIIGIVLIVLGAIAVFSALMQPLANDKSVKKLQESGELEAILADFEEAEEVSPRLKIGETYIFRRKYDRLLYVSDVAKAYYVEKFDDQGLTDKAMYLKLKNGREEKLCDIYYGEDGMLPEEIFEVLKNRNPDIECHL